MGKRMRIKRCAQVVFRAETQKTRRSKGCYVNIFADSGERRLLNRNCVVLGVMA